MIENIKNHAEHVQMQGLLEEAKTILESSSDLNQDKHKLGKLLDEIMHWTKEGDEHESYYKNFCDMMTAMTRLDFSKRLPEQYSKTMYSFMTLGLNILNEELFGKIISTKMLHSLLDGLNLKNTAIIITNATGEILFLHSKVKNIFHSEDSLFGQPMSVLIDDFDELDRKIKSEGFLKGIDVKIKFANEIDQIVTLQIAMPGLLSTYEGIAYIFTLSDRQIASINKLNKTLQEKNTIAEMSNFEDNCLKFEFTVKEKEIAILLAKGYSNNEIADNSFRSPHTIAKHIQNMFVKVGVKSKSDLIYCLKKSTY